MATIDETLQTLAQRFVHELVRALVEAPIDEIVRLAGKSGGGRPAADRTGPRGAPEDKPAKGNKRGSGRASSKRGRRSSDDIEALVSRVASFVREGAVDLPDGVAISEIAKALRVNTGELTRPMALALQRGTIKKKGDRRMARYFPGRKREE